MCLISFFQNDPSVHNTGHLYPTRDITCTQQGTVIFSIRSILRGANDSLANQEHAIALSDFSAARKSNLSTKQTLSWCFGNSVKCMIKSLKNHKSCSVCSVILRHTQNAFNKHHSIACAAEIV